MKANGARDRVCGLAKAIIPIFTSAMKREYDWPLGGTLKLAWDVHLVPILLVIQHQRPIQEPRLYPRSCSVRRTRSDKRDE
jgi:hypothetical protein